MGGGSWTTQSFATYTKSTRGVSLDRMGVVDGTYSVQEMFKANKIAKELDPYKVMRECVDSDEHPNTIPVILALDVTGSMGKAAVEVAKKLNVIMTEVYEKVADVEFAIMGIGDLSYDRAPIQISQFESDVRIAEHLDKIYFERGGGGNTFESYTAAWYMGVRHTKLDCWDRDKKGIIITMGDETLNPYLPKTGIQMTTGDNIQSDIETGELYKEAIQKFDIYHLAVDDIRNCYSHYADGINKSFGKYLDNDHLKVVTLDNIANTIVDIITNSGNSVSQTITSEPFSADAPLISW